ncbi:unnamed protein product [Trichogramma brassicae]|uniref:Uncharacterized protein n=1 Tax=Trichogramma brassicae TaxID=86971 RepID=A0A6H5J5V2_9HYME|nr:unnamed protein product [Trichogramma brassicae]
MIKRWKMPNSRRCGATGRRCHEHWLMCPISSKLIGLIRRPGWYKLRCHRRTPMYVADPQFPSGIDNYSGKEIEKGGLIRTVRISNVHRCSSVTSRLPTRSADSSDEFTADRTHQPVFMTSATCGTASSGIQHLPPLIIGN